MIKHSYQTCLRMPQVLKEDMTTICERYQFNESDFMRRAIAESIKKHLISNLHPKTGKCSLTLLMNSSDQSI